MKISIILISTFLVILLISFTIFIFFYLNNFLPREVIKKIKSNLKKITSYKNKIKLYSFLKNQSFPNTRSFNFCAVGVAASPPSEVSRKAEGRASPI